MQFTLKLLSRSDLTFFATQLRLQNAGKQKAINLNADVFVDLLFPAAREAANGMPRQFPVPVHIYGPGLLSVPHVVMRKVIAAGGWQKNWRRRRVSASVAANTAKTRRARLSSAMSNRFGRTSARNQAGMGTKCQHSDLRLIAKHPGRVSFRARGERGGRYQPSDFERGIGTEA